MRHSSVCLAQGKAFTQSRCIRTTTALLVMLGLVLVPVGVSRASQEHVHPRNVLPQDYDLWNSMTLTGPRQPDVKRSISPDGNWVAYLLKYEAQPERNEVHVRSLVDDRAYRLPGASVGEFTSNGRWYVNSGHSGGMWILDLETGAQKGFTAVGGYEVVRGTSTVVSLGTGKPDAGTSMVVANLESGEREEIPGVRSYQLHQASRRVAYVAVAGPAERIGVFDLTSMSGTTIWTGEDGADLGSLSWNQPGDALGFIRKSADGTRSVGLHGASAATGSGIRWLLPNKPSGIPDAHEAVDGSLFVSDDAHWVLVSVRPKESGESDRQKSGVRIWNARDRDLPSRLHQRATGDRVMAWWPHRNQAVSVTNGGQSLVLLSTDQSNALALTKSKALLPDGNELDFKFGKAVDLHLVDLATGQQRLLLQRQPSDGRHLSFSPSGRHVAYLRDETWWVYSLEKDSHTRLGGCAGCSLHDAWADGGTFSARLADTAYGPLGWLEGDAGFLFYDEFDIWHAPLDGSEATRVTHGREKGIRYRKLPVGVLPYSRYRSSHRGTLVEDGENLLLSSYGVNTKQSGFATWSRKDGVTDIILDDVHVSLALEIPGEDRFLYLRERFDLPRELVVVDPSTGRQQALGRSNTHHAGFAWGKAELIEYHTPEGQRLQGVLYYPAGYQPGKRYPMVVDIYEHQSGTLHHYINPSRAGYDRAANFTIDGYFVFRPDIAYTLDEPGESALRSVVAGVESILSRGLVESDAIGLMGHSFGGYETAFIITRTDLFAAAIAGAAITDTVSMYLSMLHSGPAVFHFEAQQFRMGASLFSDQAGYLANSPVHHALDINTPLLAWSGAEDDSVPIAQSFEMFVALRRLGKEHILLEYPGAGHALQGDDAEDLYTKFTDWFDYFLKKEPPAAWITGSD